MMTHKTVANEITNLRIVADRLDDLICDLYAEDEVGSLTVNPEDQEKHDAIQAAWNLVNQAVAKLEPHEFSS